MITAGIRVYPTDAPRITVEEPYGSPYVCIRAPDGAALTIGAYRGRLEDFRAIATAIETAFANARADADATPVEIPIAAE